MSLKKLTFQLQGISLWLNQGSTIRMGWEAHTTSSLDQLHGMVIKGLLGGNLMAIFSFSFLWVWVSGLSQEPSYFAGEKKFKLPQAKQTSFPNAMALHKIVNGNWF